MGSYVPSTAGQRAEMLQAVGINTIEDLYAAVPQEMRIDAQPAQAGMSELEVADTLGRMAGKNRVFSSIFRGAGAYNHYIPSIVRRITSKEEFVTAYTPYQAEISQGILQSIFEYQSMICALTGMDVSNASVYDGATAAAEAAAMCRDRKRSRILISAAAHPMVRQTIQTYAWGANAEVAEIPVKDGRTDLEALKGMLQNTDAGVYLQQPNYFGVIEDAAAIAQAAHDAGAKLILGINPMAAALLQTPKEVGADIAVGEGQPLGMPLSFGGPYLGFMATSGALERKLPGRIVGETTDDRGNRCYVLTLQAREQHIRREKASSNICSNEALCAMTASVYLAAMGPRGLRQVAESCAAHAHYLAGELAKLGFALRSGEKPFFHEFLTSSPVEPEKLRAALEAQGILGGLPVEGGVLWCCTELNTKADMDKLIAVIGEVLGR